MPIDGLTEKQTTFIKKYLVKRGIFNRQRNKDYNDALIAEYKALVDRQRDLEVAASKVDDAVIKATMQAHLNTAELIVGRNKDRPDTVSAHAELDKADDLLDFAGHKAEWQEKSRTLEPTVANATKALVRAGAEIGRIWKEANDIANEAMRVADPDMMRLALRRLAAMQELIRQGVAEQKMVQKVYEKPTSDEAVNTVISLSAAKSTLDVEVQRFNEVKAGLVKTFHPGLPQDLADRIAAIGAVISGADRNDADKMRRAAAKVHDDVAALEAAAVQPTADRQKWHAALAVVQARLTTLTNHSEADEAIHVKPRVDTIKGDITFAVSRANAHAYAEAITALDGIEEACTEAIKLADALKKLDAIEADRDARIGELEALEASTNATVNAAIDAAKAKVQVAKDGRLQNPVDVMAVTKALEEATPLIELAKRVHKQAKDAAESAAHLKSWHDHFKDWQDNLDPANTPLNPELAALLKVHTDVMALLAKSDESDANRGQAIERAKALCNACWGGLKPGLDRRKTESTAYYEALTKHQARLELFEGKPGEEAVQEFIGRLKTDAIQAETEKNGKQYQVAANILDSSEAHKDAMLAQLALGAAFFPKYKEVGTLLDSIVGRADADQPENSVAADPNQAKAAALVAEARSLRSEAYSKGVAQRDWDTATVLIDNAKSRLNEAKAMLAAVKTVETEKAKLPADNTDPSKVMAVFTPIRQAAAGYAGSDFQDKLQAADAAAAAASAQDADAGTVSSQTAAAIALCEEVIDLAARKKAYDAARAAAKAKYDSDVAPKDTAENDIHETCEKIEKLFEDAKTLAEPEGYNFDGATAKVDEALNLVNAVPAMLAQRAALAADMQSVKDELTKIKGNDYKNGCGPEIAQLQKIVDGYAEAEKAYDLGKMKALVAEGKKLVAPIDVVAERYKKFHADGYAHWAKVFADEAAALAPDLTDAQFPERAKVAEFYASFQEEVGRNNIKAATSTYDPIRWGKDTAKIVAANWTAYKPVKASTRQLLDDTKAAADAGDALTAQALAELEKRHTAALAWEEKRFDFVKARTLMEAITADTQKLAADIAEYTAYTDALDALDAALGQLDGQNASGAVTPVLDRLRGKRTNAVAMADAGERAAATALLTEASGECATAAADATAINSFSDEATKIGTDAAADGADLAALCDTARGQVSALVKEMDGVALMPRLLEMGDKVAEAKAGLPDGADAAKATLAEVSAGLVVLRQEMGHTAQVLREIESAEKKISPMIPGTPDAATFTAEAQGLMDRLSGARHLLRSDFSQKTAAMQTLEEVMRAYYPLRDAVAAHAEYVTLRNEVAPLIEPMEKHEQRYAIQDEMVEFREKVAEAAQKAEAKDHKAAMALLNRAKDLQAAAMLKAKMTGHGKPTEDEVRAILEGPNGDKELDKIVASLDPTATREVLRVALTVRFGCTLEMLQSETRNADNEVIGTTPDPDEEAGVAKKGPNIKAFYDAMCLLPSADTLTNESLAGIVRVAVSTTASDHSPGNKKMTMREGEMMNSSAYGIAIEDELEGVPDHLKPKPGKEMRQFSWNTLHEVGHAVDDKLNFTTRRAGDLGGWEYYASDVGKPAKVIADNFEYDVTYVARLMQKEADPPIPSNPDPDSITPDEWERRRVKVKAWLENTFSTRNPWQTTSSANACKIGTRCYHESMPGYWVSYPIDQRSRGVTGYQFRSPLEWFSELYAAFHSGRLADAHPAREWLEKLKNPEEV
ncbi:MAG: hypothetical protein ACU0DK_05275 [Pseudooceanicola sp.]